MDGATTAGLVLLALGPLVIADGLIEQRAGFTAVFWPAPVDDKLDHIAGVPRHWMAMGAMWVAMVAVAGAGTAGLTVLLLEAGAGVWAGMALAAYLVTATGWMLGAIAQTVGAGVAAGERAAAGTTPGWLAPLWQWAWWTEVSWVIGANLAAVAWGIAILETGFPARWAGWTAIGVGGAVAGWAAATRNVFPQLALLVPIVLGVALVAA